MSSSNPIESFRSAMLSAGIECTELIVGDGKRRRFNVPGEKGNASWYRLWQNGDFYNGCFGCWRRQVSEKWNSCNGNVMSPEHRKIISQQIAEAQKESKAEEDALRSQARANAKKLLSESSKPESHPYLSRKKVSAYGDMRVDKEGVLLLPLVDTEGVVHSIEFIAPDKRYGRDNDKRDKTILYGGDPKGHFYPVCDKEDGPLIIAEGYATCASIHEATGWSVWSARNATNLPAVASVARKKYPSRTILIAADDDERLLPEDEPNKKRGMFYAKQAASSIKGTVVSPVFSEEDLNSSDFNDMALIDGIKSVKKLFELAVGIGMGKRISIGELLSFVAGEDPESVLGNRYLCRGGSCAIIGQTSAGKSSFGMQMAVYFALGLPFFGLKPIRPLKSVIVQAENDVGDTAEMFQGILIGSGICRPETPEENKSVIQRLEQNLVILRDQSHVGKQFSDYAKKVVELHKPDLFWIDPLLSFYGNDINNQQEMTSFLRGVLGPVSEETGVIWMLLHHTGKPSKDASKTQKNWSARDFAYLGIGSSELSNWARAIITISTVAEDEFRVVFAKRGTRAGIVDEHGAFASEIYLAHSSDNICWKRIPKPKSDDETISTFSHFASTIQSEMKAADIIRLASDSLKRGPRTMWKFWSGGEGELGSLFEQTRNGFWKPKTLKTSSPYRDD
jgi:phage/plasmid primase-like uncharacterized protein